MKEQWLPYHVFGWSGYVLKEKLKLLKGSLQSWHRDHTQNLNIKICGAKDRMSVLDIKAEGEGLEDVRKLSWVKWDTFCLHRENGGFGVRRLKEFNFSFLGKWVWRMLEEKGSLWYNVLCAKYGEEGGVYVMVEEGIPCGGKQ